MDHQGLFQDWHTLLYSTYMDYHLNSALLDSPPLDYWARCRNHACLFCGPEKDYIYMRYGGHLQICIMRFADSAT